MLTADKAQNTEPEVGRWVEHPTNMSHLVAAGTIIWNDAMVSLATEGTNAGFVVPSSATASDIVLGVSRRRVDNSAGVAGAKRVPISRKPHRMRNSAGADEITALDLNKFCFAVDDETVAKTPAGVRPPAGRVVGVGEGAVLVEYAFNHAEGSAVAVFTVSAADFVNAGLTETLVLGALDAGRYAITTTTGTEFSGGGATAADVEIGISGNVDLAALTFNVFTGATTVPVPRESDTGVGFIIDADATDLELLLTVTVGTTGGLTAGSLTVRVDRL